VVAREQSPEQGCSHQSKGATAAMVAAVTGRTKEILKKTTINRQCSKLRAMQGMMPSGNNDERPRVI